MLVVGIWPILLHLATDLWQGLGPVNRDIQDRLYSRLAYICTKVTTILLFWFKLVLSGQQFINYCWQRGQNKKK